jgi:hypothetical protein
MNRRNMTKKIETTKDRAERVAAELKEAQGVLAVRQAEAEAATDKLAAIVDSWESGDADTYSTDDYERAEAEATKADALRGAAQATVNRLNRSQVNLDLRAALALAPAVEKAFNGRVPVEVRHGSAPRTTDGETLPRIVLTQSVPTIDNGGVLSTVKSTKGLQTAGVMVSYLRDSLYSPLSLSRVLDQCADAGFQVDGTDRGSQGYGDAEHQVDEAILKVYRAFASTPTLPGSPTDDVVQAWAAGLSRTLTNSYPHDKGSTNTAVFLELSRSTVGRVEHKTTTNADGSVSTTAKATVEVRPSQHAAPRHGFKEAFAQAVEGLLNTAAEGLGRCTTATGTYARIQRNPDGYTNTDPWTVSVEATFTGKLSE